MMTALVITLAGLSAQSADVGGDTVPDPSRNVGGASSPDPRSTSRPETATPFLLERGKTFYHRPTCAFIRNVPADRTETAVPGEPDRPGDKCRPCPVCCGDLVDRPLAKIEPPLGKVANPDEERPIRAGARCPTCGQPVGRRADQAILWLGARGVVAGDARARTTVGRQPSARLVRSSPTRRIYRR